MMPLIGGSAEGGEGGWSRGRQREMMRKAEGDDEEDRGR